MVHLFNKPLLCARPCRNKLDQDPNPVLKGVVIWQGIQAVLNKQMLGGEGARVIDTPQKWIPKEEFQRALKDA